MKYLGLQFLMCSPLFCSHPCLTTFGVELTSMALAEAEGGDAAKFCGCEDDVEDAADAAAAEGGDLLNASIFC